MSLPRWIIRLLACAAVLAAFAPAWAAAAHWTSGAWRTDLCDGGGPRAQHFAQHDCCVGSADPALPAIGWALRPDAPALAVQPFGATTARPAVPFTRGLTRAPPSFR
ncbi:MAG: hypothetical protein N3D71_11970 [Burkholderiaceae bacterium]|nr:hypothetical protein [Burkholderiaceae bacterium]